jgi:hypothetical protein
VGLCVVLLAPLTSVVVEHLRFATAGVAYSTARQAADTAVASALAQILTDPALAYGQQGDPTLDVFCRDGHGVVTFNPLTAETLGIGLSMNNLNGTAQPAQGIAGQVPANAILLVGAGWSGPTRLETKVIVHLPPFSFAIAANSDIHSRGGLVVGQAPPGVSLSQALLNPALLLAADIDSNSAARDALSLGLRSYIAGNAQAVGNISLGSQSTVRGNLLPGSNAVTLPQVNLQQFDTTGQPGLTALGSTSAGGTVSGFVRADGDLTLTGPLTLNNAVVYVAGKLQAPLGVQGTGALIVQSDATLGSTNLGASGQVALLSGGDVTINGTGAGAAFRGLVYTSGALACSQMTLQGVFVANNPTTSNVQMDHINILFDPSMENFAFPVASGATTTLPGYNYYQTPAGLSGYALNMWIPFNADLSNVLDAQGNLLPDSQLLSQLSYGIAFNTGQAPLYTAAAAHDWGSAGTTLYGNAKATNSGSRFWNLYRDDADIRAHGWDEMMVGADTRQELNNFILANDHTARQSMLDSGWADTQQTFLANLKQLLQPYIGLQRSYRISGGVEQFTFDLNKFIAPADRARVMLWRQL